jgi:hypothetical protein
MYEIWLALNILWEIALDIWPLLLVVALLLALVVAVALARSPGRWRAGLVPAIGIGVVVAVLAFLVVPGLTRSSLAELAYWVDWLNLVAIAAGFGAVALAFAWPLLAMRRGARG